MTRAGMTRAAAARDERGSVAPLIVGMAAVLVLLTAVVVDASAAFLRRQELNAAADAAALAATDGLQGEQVYRYGLGDRVGIDPVTARGQVARYLRSSGLHDRYPGLTWQVRTSATRVVVRLRAPLRLPFDVAGIGDQAMVTGTAASVVVVID